MNAFDRYAPFIQDFIYSHDWESLRSIQVAAADAIFNTQDNVLLAKSDMASFVDSLVAPLSLINALLVAIARSKSDVVEHFERLEHIWDEYGVFVSMEEEDQ